jgi:hypothetical protein
MTICQNCEREIKDVTPYGYNRDWVHVHSGNRECNKPSVAVPKPNDTEEGK